MEEKTIEAIELLAKAYSNLAEETRLIKKLLIVEHDMLSRLLKERGNNIVPFGQNLKHT